MGVEEGRERVIVIEWRCRRRSLLGFDNCYDVRAGAICLYVVNACRDCTGLRSRYYI